MPTARDGRRLTILHVSDTQFGRYHHFTDEDSLAAGLIRDLDVLADQGVPGADLIVLSGDIAETGVRSEYEQAQRFVDRLREHTGLPPERLVLVPGNHDVNWKRCSSYVDECDADEITPSEPYWRKWKDYQRFVAGLHGPAAFTEVQPYRLQTFDDLGVAVAALNSTMRETHEAHYGHCGDDQLRWFAQELRDHPDLLRIGVLHHNARRKATADEENLRDEDALTRILGPHLDLLLHGHTHEGTQDRLADGTLILATGSAAVTARWRPGGTRNQYQVLTIRPGRLTRWTRHWDGVRWVADTSASPGTNSWQVTIDLPTPGWSKPPPEDPRPDPRSAMTHPGEHRVDFATQVREVTRIDLGAEASIDLCTTGVPPLRYLLCVRHRAPRRCVGIIDGRPDEPTLTRFAELISDPLRRQADLESIIVHPGPDDPDLRPVAAGLGIQLKTLTAYSDLLELSPYRTWLTRRLESDETYPQDLYQPQRFRPIDRFGTQATEPSDDLLADIHHAIQQEDGRFVAVLGDAGYGKSFLVRRLAYLLLRDERATRTPIVIYLRERDRRESIGEMVAAALIPSRAAFQIDRFRRSLEAGTLVLLIDGYDEFAVRVGYANAAAQLRTFTEAMRGRAKIVLTTRPSHFRSTDQVTSKLFEELASVHDGRVYQLEPFDTDQQQAFLTRWFELHHDPDPAATAERWMTALSRVDNLPELARTPRMLSFMVKDIELAKIDAVADGQRVSAADLYQALVDRWLADEAARIDPDDERTISAEQRMNLLEDLALRLWRAGERDVSEPVLLQAVQDGLDLHRHELTLDQAAQLVGGRTLLKTDRGTWQFAHQSVWEFLLAKRLAVELRAERNDELGAAELTGLTRRFLRDLAPHEATAWLRRIAGGRA